MCTEFEYIALGIYSEIPEELALALIERGLPLMIEKQYYTKLDQNFRELIHADKTTPPAGLSIRQEVKYHERERQPEHLNFYYINSRLKNGDFDESYQTDERITNAILSCEFKKSRFYGNPSVVEVPKGIEYSIEEEDCKYSEYVQTIWDTVKNKET